MSLIVKAFLYSNWSSDEATEIRRFSIDQDVATSYAYLTQKIAQVFSDLKADEVKITYLDEDGDRISISSDEELTYALEQLQDAKLLRLYLTKSSVKCPDFFCHPGLRFNRGCGPCHPHPHKKASTEEHLPDDTTYSTSAASDDTKQPQADDSQGNCGNPIGNAGWPWPGTGFGGTYAGHPFAAGFRPFIPHAMRPGPFGGPGQGAARFGPRGRWCGPRAWGNNPWGPRGWGGQGLWGGCEDWAKCCGTDCCTASKPSTAATTTENPEDHFEDHHEDSDTKEQQNEQ